MYQNSGNRAFGICAVKPRSSINWESLLFLVCYVCCALSGTVPQLPLSIVVVGCSALISCYGNAVAIWPIMIFFYLTLGQVFGVSAYRLFSLIYLGTYFYRRKKPRITKASLLPIFVYLSHLLVVIFDYSARTALFFFVDVICIVILCTDELQDRNNLHHFFESYAISALIASITGLICDNYMSVMQDYSGQIVNINRYMATFEDPNYLGFFYTIAIFSIVTLKLFRPVVRYVMLVLLYGVVFMTMSMTAVIGNLLLWVALFLIRGQIKFRTVIICLICLALGMGVYSYGLNNPDTPFWGTFCLRIEDKLDALLRRDMDYFTTGRTSLSDMHLNVYRESSLINKLFGGHAVNTQFVILPIEEKAVAHNEYVDMLLNVGIVGWVVMIGYIVAGMMRKVVLFRCQRDEAMLCGIMIKMIWLYYAATLTLFLDFRFMFAFFI